MAKPKLVVRVAAIAAVLVVVAFAHPRSQAGAQQQEPMPTINPATGEPPGAPTGCCCFPKSDNPAGPGALCKSNVTEFDCRAECAELRDGRLPSGCTWSKGACPK